MQRECAVRLDLLSRYKSVAPGQFSYTAMIEAIDKEGKDPECPILQLQHLQSSTSLERHHFSHDGISAENILSVFERGLNDETKGIIIIEIERVGYLACDLIKIDGSEWVKVRLSQHNKYQHYDLKAQRTVDGANLKILSPFRARMSQQVILIVVMMWLLRRFLSWCMS